MADAEFVADIALATEEGIVRPAACEARPASPEVIREATPAHFLAAATTD
jgi:hypothetical protein